MFEAVVIIFLVLICACSAGPTFTEYEDWLEATKDIDDEEDRS